MGVACVRGVDTFRAVNISSERGVEERIVAAPKGMGPNGGSVQVLLLQASLPSGEFSNLLRLMICR